MYKVEYYTLALMNDGTTGNVKQRVDVCYTNLGMLDIQRELDEYLKQKRRRAVVTRVERIDGHVLAAAVEEVRND